MDYTAVACMSGILSGGRCKKRTVCGTVDRERSICALPQFSQELHVIRTQWENPIGRFTTTSFYTVPETRHGPTSTSDQWFLLYVSLSVSNEFDWHKSSLAPTRTFDCPLSNSRRSNGSNKIFEKTISFLMISILRILRSSRRCKCSA